MKYLPASILAAIVAVASTAAIAQASDSKPTPEMDCAIGHVTGIGGSAQSFREYLALPNRDRDRYVADNPIQCKVSGEGRASECVGMTYLRNDEVSVYDEIDSTTMSVVARVELDHGTYPVIISVRKQDVKCEH